MIKLWKNIIYESLLVKKIIKYYEEENKRRREEKSKALKNKEETDRIKEENAELKK